MLRWPKPALTIPFQRGRGCIQRIQPSCSPGAYMHACVFFLVEPQIVLCIISSQQTRQFCSCVYPLTSDPASLKPLTLPGAIRKQSEECLHVNVLSLATNWTSTIVLCWPVPLDAFRSEAQSLRKESRLRASPRQPVCRLKYMNPRRMGTFLGHSQSFRPLFFTPYSAWIRGQPEAAVTQPRAAQSSLCPQARRLCL